MSAATGRPAAQPTSAALPVKRRFAENLIALRARAGLSQEQTARRAGLHVTALSLLERGMRLPRLDTIVKLAGALDVEPCALLTGMAWRLGESAKPLGAYVRQGPAAEQGDW